MITFRLRYKRPDRRKHTLESIERISGVFRVVCSGIDGAAELQKNADTRKIAKKIESVPGVYKVESLSP